jgi:hypothetical protein
VAIEVTEAAVADMGTAGEEGEEIGETEHLIVVVEEVLRREASIEEVHGTRDHLVDEILETEVPFELLLGRPTHTSLETAEDLDGAIVPGPLHRTPARLLLHDRHLTLGLLLAAVAVLLQDHGHYLGGDLDPQIEEETHIKAVVEEEEEVQFVVVVGDLHRKALPDPVLHDQPNEDLPPILEALLLHQDADVTLAHYLGLHRDHLAEHRVGRGLEQHLHGIMTKI